MKHAVIVIALLFATGLPAYAAESVAIAPITLTVEDAKTNAPLDDVLVVVSHPLFVVAGRNAHEGVYYKQSGDLMIVEAVTGEDGVVHFPAMLAPRPSADQRLRDDAPMLLLYKPGYLPQLVDDTRTARSNTDFGPVPSTLDSAWKGKTVELERAPGSLDLQQAGVMINVLEGLDSAGSNCRWTQMPMLFERLERAANNDEQLRKRLDWIQRSNPCGTEPRAMAWRDAGGVLELHIDLFAMEDSEATSEPAPRTGRMNVVAHAGKGADARGVVFFQYGKDASRRELRINGESASSGPLEVQAGDNITVRYLDFSAGRIRQGVIGKSN